MANTSPCGSIALFILIFSAAFAVKAMADANMSLPEKVYIGEVVEIPRKTLTHNGETKTAEIYIRKPQGGLFKGNAITIDQFGVYTVEYRANIAGENILETDTFTAMRTPKDMLFIHQQLLKFCEIKVIAEDRIWYRLRIFSILTNLKICEIIIHIGFKNKEIAKSKGVFP